MMHLSGTGRFVKDPELREIPNSVCCEFSLAINEVRTVKRGEKIKKTCFLDFVIYDAGAEVLQKHCRKGDLVQILAVPRQDNWTNAEGQKRSKKYFRVESFKLLPNKKREEDSNF